VLREATATVTWPPSELFGNSEWFAAKTAVISSYNLGSTLVGRKSTCKNRLQVQQLDDFDGGADGDAAAFAPRQAIYFCRRERWEMSSVHARVDRQLDRFERLRQSALDSLGQEALAVLHRKGDRNRGAGTHG